MATGTGRPTRPFRSSGACGRRAAKSGFCFSPIATSSSIRRWSTTSGHSERRWPSSAPEARSSSARTARLSTCHWRSTTNADRYVLRIYLALYQAITGPEDRQKIFRELSRDFFDLIVVDECHRGSAAEDSAWREILEHFSSATQIGMTATPKETKYVSNIHYFGQPVYRYSLKQGIQDGFLAPYKVIKVHIDRDIEGYRPNRANWIATATRSKIGSTMGRISTEPSSSTSARSSSPDGSRISSKRARTAFRRPSSSVSIPSTRPGCVRR